MKNYTYLDLIEALGIGGAHPGGSRLTQFLLGKEKLTNKSIVLDAGCGTGQTSAFLFKKFQCQIYALDINQGLLIKAKKRFKQEKVPAKVIQGDIQKLPFQPSTFDYVLSESVLPFTTIEQSVSEISRVLKDNGCLIAIEMTIEKQLSEKEQTSLQEFYGFTNFLTENEWKKVFQKNGLKVIEITHPKSVQFLSLFNNTEFDLSSEISEEIFSLLNKHEYFMQIYKDKLSYRVYKCQKEDIR